MERDPRAAGDGSGLCVNCIYAKRISGRRENTYFLCERSLTDANFPKYPRLPVLRCAGYVAGTGHNIHE